MLKMDLEYDKEILFVRLEGILDSKSSYKINNYLVPVLTKHKIENVIYNFSKLKSISQSGVDAILNTKCIVKRNKGRIFLCASTKEVTEELKRLHLKIFSSEQVILKRLEV